MYTWCIREVIFCGAFGASIVVGEDETPSVFEILW